MEEHQSNGRQSPQHKWMGDRDEILDMGAIRFRWVVIAVDRVGGAIAVGRAAKWRWFLTILWPLQVFWGDGSD